MNVVSNITQLKEKTISQNRINWTVTKDLLIWNITLHMNNKSNFSELKIFSEKIWQKVRKAGINLVNFKNSDYLILKQNHALCFLKEHMPWPLSKADIFDIFFVFFCFFSWNVICFHCATTEPNFPKILILWENWFFFFNNNI